MKPGEALDIESQIFSDWIIGHYQAVSYTHLTLPTIRLV